MNLESLHELECVRLESDVRRSHADLASCLRSLGFTLHDDVYSLDRKGKVPPWQHRSIVELHVFRDGVEVYDEGGWDLLILDYLFASLPEEYVSKFLDVVFEMAEKLQLRPMVSGNPVDRKGLTEIFESCARDLMSEYAETAGSEELAILIAGTYPRRRP